MADVLAETKQGLLRGVERVSILGQTYSAFLGIPFAKPPVGSLRFKDPEPPVPWTGTRDAQKEGGMCASTHMIHRDLRGSDDCLYLNVYTPEVSSDLKPVMVYIHGGGFMVGCADSNIYGPDFFLQHDVVLVTTNYRLGVLGFLHIPECGIGNAGMKDQVAALRWVQDNISNFGGDPNNVTLFGSSAGACSINLHVVSPLAKGLFHRAILQSGSAMNFWAYSEETKEKSFHLGDILGFDTNNPDELVSRLQEVPALDLVELQYKTVTEKDKLSVKIIFPFVPTIEENHDKAFISESPENLMKNGNFMKIPYLAGVGTCEGSFVLRAPPHTAEYLENIDNNFSTYLQQWMGFTTCDHPLEREGRKVKEFFFGDRPVSKKTLRNYVEMQSDLLISYEVDRMNRFFLSQSDVPVYNYLFDYEGKRDFFKTFFVASEIPGASHGAELSYIFPMTLLEMPFEADQSDGAIIQTLTKMWTNFAKNGDPNSPDINVTWHQTDRKTFGYLEIGHSLSFKQGRAFQRRMELWDSIYNSGTLQEMN